MTTGILALTRAASALCLGGVANAAPVFASSSYRSSFTFPDMLPSTSMTLAFDGTFYYTSSGDDSARPYAQYDGAGTHIQSASPTPGIDFRSIYTDGSGTLYARGYANPTIFRQTAFGTFTTHATLGGANPLDDQSAVVLDGAEYVAQSGGVVSRWDAAGNSLGTVSLIGFGGSESGFPQNRGIAVLGAYWLTYDNKTLSAWDHSGVHVDTTTLTDGGTSFDSHFSYSYANNMFWVVDHAGGLWHGYDVQAVAVPAPASVFLLATGLMMLVGFGPQRRREFRRSVTS